MFSFICLLYFFLCRETLSHAILLFIILMYFYSLSRFEFQIKSTTKCPLFVCRASTNVCFLFSSFNLLYFYLFLSLSMELSRTSISYVVLCLFIVINTLLCMYHTFSISSLVDEESMLLFQDLNFNHIYYFNSKNYKIRKLVIVLIS